MFRPRHFRLLLGGFLAAICSIIFLAGARHVLLSPRHVFPDGTVLKFEKVTWGRHHVFSEESQIRSFVREVFPKEFPLLFPEKGLGVSTTTSEPSLVVWFLRDEPKPARGAVGVERFALVADETGRIHQNEIRGWGERWPNRFAALSGYPKASASFPVIIADAKLQPIWQFTVTNPHPIQPRNRETAVVDR